MFCPQCGREYRDKVNFCCHCGTAMVTPVSQDKKLMRSRKDRKIAGICGGLGDYLGIDSTLVRLIWLLLIFFGGTGVLAYIIAWIIMPEAAELKPAEHSAPATAQPVTNP